MSVKIEDIDFKLAPSETPLSPSWQYLVDAYNELGALEIEQFGKWQVMEEERKYHSSKKLPMIEEIIKRGLLTSEMKNEMSLLNPILREIVVEKRHVHHTLEAHNELKNKIGKLKDQISRYREEIKKINGTPPERSLEAELEITAQGEDITSNKCYIPVREKPKAMIKREEKRDRRVERFRKAWWPHLPKAYKEARRLEERNNPYWMD